MRHIHTSIVSMHLATRGNNKILRTPPPHISSSKERLAASLVAPLPNSEQTISLPQIIHTQSRRQNTSITTIPPLQHPHTRHTSSRQLHPHTHHIVTPAFVDRPRRSDCTAGPMDGEAGWWTTSGNIGPSPLARVMGVGRQQQQQ